MSQSLHTGVESWLDVGVGSHVHRLFLAPHDLGVRISSQLTKHEIKWEWRDLFQSADVDVILKSPLLSLLIQFIENLSRAQDQTLHMLLLRWMRQSGGHTLIHDQSSEPNTLNIIFRFNLIIKVCEWRLALRMSEQVLWRHDNQWFSELTMHLSS